MKRVDKYEIIAQTLFPGGDDFYATQNKRGQIHIGYTNDYPMQHGNGESIIVSESAANILLELCNKSK